MRIPHVTSIRFDRTINKCSVAACQVDKNILAAKLNSRGMGKPLHTPGSSNRALCWCRNERRKRLTASSSLLFCICNCWGPMPACFMFYLGRWWIGMYQWLHLRQIYVSQPGGIFHTQELECQKPGRKERKRRQKRRTRERRNIGGKAEVDGWIKYNIHTFWTCWETWFAVEQMNGENGERFLNECSEREMDTCCWVPR